MPSPLQLELTPHELFALPPDTPAIGPAFRVEVTPKDRPTFFAIARLTTYTFKNRDCYQVFFRDEQRPHNEILRCRTINSIASYKERFPIDGPLEYATKLANSKRVFRFWQIPDSPYCLVINSGGTGRILQQQGNPHDGAIFHWDVRQKEEVFWKWNTIDFHAFCHYLTMDSISKCNFALNWQSLSSKEKRAFATKCEYGDWEQLLRLMTCVLQLITYHFGPFPRDYLTDSQWWFAYPIEKRHDRPAVFFARRWQEAIFSIFRPTFWPTIPLCVLRWREKELGFENFVECEMPTMHEFLEAQLHLRNFLRPHLPQHEIEALLIP